MNTFGKSMRFRRRINRMTLEDLSRLSGIPVKRLRNLERGMFCKRRFLPSELLSICCALNWYADDAVRLLIPNLGKFSRN